jgi:hypothetical protein
VVVQGLPKSLAYAPGSYDPAPSNDEGGWIEERNRISTYLKNYPTLADWKFQEPIDRPVGVASYGDDSIQIRLEWPNPQSAELDSAVIARRTTVYRAQNYAFPSVGGSDRMAHPLLAWWSILFALSMLARYEPKVWVNCISVNESKDASAVEHLLDQALSSIPELIHRTIVSVAS